MILIRTSQRRSRCKVTYRLRYEQGWTKKLLVRSGTVSVAQRSKSLNRRIRMIRKIMTVAVLGASLAIAACNTVRGAAQDVNSVANEVDSAT